MAVRVGGAAERTAVTATAARLLYQAKVRTELRVIAVFTEIAATNEVKLMQRSVGSAMQMARLKQSSSSCSEYFLVVN